MNEDTVIAYGRIVEEGDIRVLAMFGTTNRWFYMQNTKCTEQDVQNVEMNSIWLLRMLAQKQGISELEETVVLTGKLQQEDDDFTEYNRVGHVGEFDNEQDCVDFAAIAIHSLFAGRKRRNANYCDQALDGLVNPVVDAVNAGDKEKLFYTQARLIDSYRGPPLQNYIQKLCQMIRNKRNPDLIKLQMKLITAIEKGEYEAAARFDRRIRHTPLDNRAQGI